MHIEKIFFLTPEEVPVQIEAELILKSKDETQDCGIIILHPHPQMGGNMDFKTLYRLSRGLYQAGFDVLRFNFRGVGQSEGEFGGGILEAYDFAGAYAFMNERGYSKIAACGYSFGSVVGMSQLSNIPIICYAAVGFPNRSESFTDIIHSLLNIQIPTLFVSGDVDEFSDLSEITQQFEFETDPEIVSIKNEGHFFLEKWKELVGNVTQFMLKHLK
ncbi:MAG: hypothetical protein KAR20_25420 [Candidatus Heimdallarchaeota archaeon]|nr:hypothetical protein [Candidatus Heimdallarchaeota archaeon]